MSRGKIKSKIKSSKKLPWVGMEVTRVKLDPQQAVLSCCSSSLRSQNTYLYWQCAESCGDNGQYSQSS